MGRGVEDGLPARSCALPGCGTIFTPQRTTRRFCGDACRYEASRRLRGLRFAREEIERQIAALAGSAAA